MHLVVPHWCWQLGYAQGACYSSCMAWWCHECYVSHTELHSWVHSSCIYFCSQWQMAGMCRDMLNLDALLFMYSNTAFRTFRAPLNNEIKLLLRAIEAAVTLAYSCLISMCFILWSLRSISRYRSFRPLSYFDRHPSTVLADVAAKFTSKLSSARTCSLLWESSTL